MNTKEISAISSRLEQIKNELAVKASQDERFRSSLLTDPNGTIEKAYSLPLGTLKDLTIEVAEETSDSIIIPIPPDMANMELTDDQLEAVAGGVAFSAFAIGAAVGFGVIVAGGSAAIGARQGW